jgi:hypothetical protein
MLPPALTQRIRRTRLRLASRGPVEEGNEFVDNDGSVRHRRDIGCDQSLSLEAERRISAEGDLEPGFAGAISRHSLLRGEVIKIML